MTALKECGRCCVTKPRARTDFPYQSKAKDGFGHWCLECCRAYHRERRNNDPTYVARKAAQQREARKRPENKAAARRWHLEHKYGLSSEDYESMRVAQDGRCAVCDRPTERLQVDHCHTTGRLRGLLCPNCNKVLGLMSDDPSVLRRAANYLESFE